MPGSDDYVFDEESGEWMPASELAAKRAAAGAVEVRDAVGNVLADGDQVTLIKDLEVKKPNESKGPYDYYKIRTQIPADRVIASRRFEMTDRMEAHLKAILEDAARTASFARRLPTVSSQPAGLRGTPSRGQVTRASASASWARSSASAKSPV